MKSSKILPILFSLLFLGSCDIQVIEKDSFVIETEEGVFSGVEPAAALSSAYQDLRSAMEPQDQLLALAEHPSDEYMGPTRGTDWGDNGVWRTLHQHTWDASHAYVTNTWNALNERVFKLGQLLHPVSEANASQQAEAKFLRAWYMYWILDLWGKIPIREADEGAEIDPRVLEAPEAYEYIMSDLDDAIAGLPSVGPGVANTNKANKAAARYLKAKMLLNKATFLGGSPEAADMTEVVQLVDLIKADGFALYEGYFDIFKDTDDTETIFWTASSIGNRAWCSLHYKQPTPDNTGGGWNGFTTTAEFYELFEGPESNEPGKGQEERRGYVPTDGSHYGIGYGFLVGQQYDANGNPLTDRPGNPLVYTKEMPGLAGNNERTGIRIIKYHPEDGAFNGHVILMRYADAHLMKAEAILRGGSSSDNAADLVNELRSLRDASPATSVDLNYILDERGRELYLEMWRRNDQIRFGTFTDAWQFKDASEPYRTRFPIPDQALASNPNLIQNPGY